MAYCRHRRLNLNFHLIVYAFGKSPKVMALWVCMQLSTLLVVYPAFYYWATHRKPGLPGQRKLQRAGKTAWAAFLYVGRLGLLFYI